MDLNEFELQSYTMEDIDNMPDDIRQVATLNRCGYRVFTIGQILHVSEGVDINDCINIPPECKDCTQEEIDVVSERLRQIASKIKEKDSNQTAV